MNYDQLSEVNAGDKVVVRWPATGTESVVEYRGRNGNVAVVWTGTLQVSIAQETILRKAE